MFRILKVIICKLYVHAASISENGSDIFLKYPIAQVGHLSSQTISVFIFDIKLTNQNNVVSKAMSFHLRYFFTFTYLQDTVISQFISFFKIINQKR